MRHPEQHHRHHSPWDSAPAWAIEIGWGLQTIIERLKTMSAEVEALTAQVKANNDLIDSATALINGIAGRIDAAVAAAVAAGASSTDLAAITALSTELKAKDDTLAAAVTANTPSA
jgi:uncharacterized small protein (DUF1192 family)